MNSTIHLIACLSLVETLVQKQYFIASKNRGPATYKWRDPCVLIKITFITKQSFMCF